MENMAWFSEYLAAHRPDGVWSHEADWAVRACGEMQDAASQEYIIAWADSLIEGKGCVPAAWRALFTALAATGEEKYRAAIEDVMAGIGRVPADAIDSAEAMYALLPFRMAYEMKLGGMEKVGMVAALFCAARDAMWNAENGCFGDQHGTALALLALTDAIGTCADQLYEHWRAMVNIYREVLRGALAAQIPVDSETAVVLVYAIYEGVRMRLIDPERYLPVAERRIAQLRAAGMNKAADMLEMKGGAL